MNGYIDEGLFSFGTVRQIEIAQAINRLGSQVEAAKELGLTPPAITSAMAALRRKAAMRGYSPGNDMTRIVPDPFVVKGVSTYYNKDGNPTGQWVKSSLKEEALLQIMKEAVEALKEEIPRVSPVANIQSTNDQLLNCYVITDFHLGMLSWEPETGEDWDIKIAEDLIIRWFQQAIAHSPDASTAVLAQLSDLLHVDGMEPLTPASKHLLDADGRFPKVVRTVIRILRTVIDMLLQKHDKVHVVMSDANHDPVSQIWLREWLAVLYECEPRITVDTSPNPYNAFEFGNVALFFHHGHKRKISNVSEVFVAKFREMFGRTKYAYAHMGHLHHLDVKENQMMIVEQHRTLAPADAYAARGGWLSGRDAKVITYHREFGEVSRLTINSDMVK